MTSTTSNPSAELVPDCRPFTRTLWLWWVGAAVFNQTLIILADYWVNMLAERAGNPAGVDIVLSMTLWLAPIFVFVSATTQWLVLHRVLRELPWLAWLGATVFGGLVWLVGMWSLSQRGTILMMAIALLVAVISAFVSAGVLSFASRSWPSAFFVCSIAAAGANLILTTPGTPVHVHLIAMIDGFVFRGERQLLFMRLNPARLLPDLTPIAQLNAINSSIELGAGVISAAITGYGLWRLCRPPWASPIVR